MPADPNRVAAFFAAAVALPAEARAAYLDEACSDDAELRRRVEALLQAHDDAGSFLEKPAAASLTTDAPAGQWIDRDAPLALSEGPGTRIGPYKLLQQIGEGGMGVVYMAEQEQPVRRRVALKIIKPGMDSAQVIARFESERQALAMMDHPNIAKVLDAGATESSRPYFVMELVYGVPITKFCDDSQLTPRQRLELFVPICQAIQHAHQKGIIHRDIKPSNVLVTMHDDKPVPKVIDFGVAKAVEQRLTEKSLFTAFGAVVGTLEYMSPEQAEMNAFGVDTRSDVYSLGVLLYELLTGTTPLERKRLRQAAYTEVLRLIKEVEPQRPSVRLSSSGDLPKIAAARKTEPGRLSGLLRGEIDWIVMRCLEKDRTRRYESASALARDVERYLRDEAVEACPPSLGYRLGKFARKYRVFLSTAAAFAAMLVIASGVSIWLAVWAMSAEQDANQQRDTSDAAKQDALKAKSEAVKQRDEARLTAYAAGMNLASRAWEENNVPRARELLEEVPKSAGGRDLRGFEWYYLSRVCHSEMRTLDGHDHFVCAVAYSPDGQRLASGSADRTVKIWDSRTGKELFSLNHQPNNGPVFCVAFSPDGQRLASGGAENTVKIWDSATGKELVSLKGHTGCVGGVAFSPDGQRLASGGDKTARIWDSATGKELLSLKGHAEAVGPVAFSPDGRRLASGSGDKTVKIWDSATGKELLSLKGHNDEVWTVAFSPDGLRLVSGSDDRTVRIWDSLTGKELACLKGHGAEVNNVAFSPDGQHLASASDDRTVKIWDSSTGKEPFSIAGVGPVAFSPDGQRFASGSTENTVKIWDSTTGKELLSLKGHAGKVSSVAFSPDGQRLSSGGANSTVIWDIATGKEMLSVAGAGAGGGPVAFSPDGQHLASVNNYFTVTVWESATGKELFTLKRHGGEVLSVAFSPDGQRLASGCATDGTIKIWDSATGKELLSLKGHSDSVRSVAFSPDGQRLASASNDKTVKIWDSATGKELFSLKAHPSILYSVAFSPDGQRLAAATFNSVTIWETIIPPEVLDRRAANQLVADLFRQMGFRASVLERLRALTGMSSTRRQEALTAAQTYPQNPETLHNLAWNLVALPDRRILDYRKALRYSEAACQLEPKNGLYMTTLGVAYYRAGNYLKALETLQKSEKINQAENKTSHLADLAFLAMTQQRLGHTKEAGSYLQQLRERMKDPRLAQDAESQGFLREAETLLAKPTTPGSK